MSKQRAYGADARLLAGRRSLDFKSTDLSSTQPLGDDPLLGRGRNAQDPHRGLVTAEGQPESPLDLRGTGFWLTGLSADPVTTAVAATGPIVFAVNPSPGDTITLNGAVWTFVSGAASTGETEIQGTLTQTLDALQASLEAVVRFGNRTVGIFQGAFDAMVVVRGAQPAAIGDAPSGPPTG